MDITERLKLRWTAWRAQARDAQFRWSARLLSVRTSQGRERLRLGVYARFPRIIWGLAAVYRRIALRRVRVVAVVGSFGKTTTTRTTAMALGLPDPGSAGWNAGTAIAANLLRVRPWHRHAVLEVGIVDVGQMERLARYLKPSVAVVTCVGSEHLSSLGSLEATRAEKGKMVAAIPANGWVILNGDDPNVVWMKTLVQAPVLTYGFTDTHDIQATDLQDDNLSGLQFNVQIDGRTHTLRTQLLGRTMVYPFLAALCAAKAEGIGLAAAIAALESLGPTYNRLQLIPLDGGANVILDGYKGALETIDAALVALARLTASRRIVVVGDVEEPPGSQGPIYKALGTRLAKTADRVLFVGGKTNYARLRAGMLLGGMERASLENLRSNPSAIADWLTADTQPGDLILIKGRSTQHLERVALILTGRTVSCAARVCSRRHDCASCPLLEVVR